MARPEAQKAEAPPRAARGRPRSEDCRCAILEATADLLEERAYAGVSIEAIAERAGVSKQTIYEWWKSRASLAMQAYAERQLRRNPFPDTGNVREDLLSLMRQSCRLLRGGRFGETMAGFIAAAQSDAALAEEFRETYVQTRRKHVAEVLDRGVERGELPRGLARGFMMDLMFGPVWYRLLLRNAPLDDAFAEAVVDAVLSATLREAR